MASHRANPVQKSDSGTAWLGSDLPEFGLVMLEPSRASKFKPGISINWTDYLESSRSMKCLIGTHHSISLVPGTLHVWARSHCVLLTWCYAHIWVLGFFEHHLRLQQSTFYQWILVIIPIPIDFLGKPGEVLPWWVTGEAAPIAINLLGSYGKMCFFFWMLWDWLDFLHYIMRT